MKAATKAQKKHFAALVSLGCIVLFSTWFFPMAGAEAERNRDRRHQIIDLCIDRGGIPITRFDKLVRCDGL